MKLTIVDRIAFLGVLPEKGSNVDNNVVVKLREKVDFKIDEITSAEIKQENGMIIWKDDSPLATEGVEFEFEPYEFNLVKKALDKLDSEGELSLKDGTNGLYNKFVEAVVV